MMKTLENFIITRKLLSESLSDIDSDSISYSADIWFKDNKSLKDEFYSVVDEFNVNGVVPKMDNFNKLVSKIDLRNFVDFVLGDVTSNLDKDTTDYVYIFKKIIQTAKRK